MIIVVCEDDELYRKSLCDKITLWGENNGHKDVWIKYYASSEDMIDALNTNPVADIYFLDIQFYNDIDGVQLAKKIRQTDEHTPIVFITNYIDFWYEGYEVNALRYLNKPIYYEDIAQCLDIAWNMNLSRVKDFFVLYVNGQKIALRYSEMLFIEAQYPYLLIHALNNKVIRTRGRFMDIVKCINSDLFHQCHRSYLVNIMYVRGIRYDELLIASGERLPLSRKHSYDINLAFDDFYQGGMVHALGTD